MAGPWEKYAKEEPEGPWRKYAPKEISASEDVMDTVLPSIARLGINTIGLPGSVGEMVSGAVDYAGNQLGVSTETMDSFKSGASRILRNAPSPALRAMSTGPTSDDLRQRVEGAVGGPLYEPHTFLGRVVDKGIQFSLGAGAGAGNAAVKAITNVGIPALTSEVGGTMAENTFGKQARPYGEIIGGVVGAGVPATLKPSRTVSPGRERAAAILEKEGVTPLASQVTGSPKLAQYEARNGGAAFSEAVTKQKEDFTKAALRRVGIDDVQATPEVVADNFRRMGDEFNTLGVKNNLGVTSGLRNKANVVWQNYERTIEPAYKSNVVKDAYETIKSWAPGTIVSGEKYNALRSQLATDLRSATGKNKDAIGDMIGILDDAMERGISGADKARWHTVRRQWKNMLVVEKAIDPEYYVAPHLLRSAAKTQGKRAFSTGRNDFTELSNAGSLLLKRPPDSGTPGGISSMLPFGIGGTVGAGIGGSVGTALGGPILGTALGTAAGIAAPAVAGRAAMTPTMQQWLMNRYAAGDPRAVLLLDLLQGRQALPPPVQ